MKEKYLFISLFLLLVGSAFAQKRVAPTAEQITRVTRTTTNVVLTGDNMLLAAALRSAVEKNWKITPVVFIDGAEFEKNSADANRTFLVIVDGKFKKDKGQNDYVFLNFLMGGGLSMTELSDFILLPLTCTGQDEDKAILFMEAFVDIVQQHLNYLQENPKQAKTDLDTYNSGIEKLRNRNIVLQTTDIAYPISDDELAQLFNGHLNLATDKEIEHTMATGTLNKAVAFTLYPEGDQVTGGYAYNLLITSDTHELLYFKRHKITGPNQNGFLKEEIKRISIPFKNK